MPVVHVIHSGAIIFVPPDCPLAKGCETNSLYPRVRCVGISWVIDICDTYRHRIVGTRCDASSNWEV